MTSVAEQTGFGVIVNRGALLAMLTGLAPAINQRANHEVLRCVKLSATGDALTACATDLEVCATIKTNQVQTELAGEILVPLDRLRNIIAKAPDDSLKLTGELDRLRITGEDSSFKLNALRVSDFPAMPEMDGDVDFEMPASDVKRLISQSKFAVDSQPGRYAMHGVLIDVNKEVRFVASEGHMLAVASAPLLVPPKEKLKAIVPTKAISLLEKLIDDPDDAVGVQIKENRVAFILPYATLVSNLIEGSFPMYEEIIPTDCPHKATASTADLRLAYERAAMLADDNSIAITRAVKMNFSKSSGLNMQAVNPGAGESEVNFPCKYDGLDVLIGVKPEYILPPLCACDTDEITFEINEEKKAALITSGPMFKCAVWLVNLD